MSTAEFKKNKRDPWRIDTSDLPQTPFVPLDTNKLAYRHLRGTDREFITLGPTRNDEPTGEQE